MPEDSMRYWLDLAERVLKEPDEQNRAALIAKLSGDDPGTATSIRATMVTLQEKSPG